MGRHIYKQSNEMIEGRTILCFASGYDAPPTSKHHVMHVLTERNVFKRLAWLVVMFWHVKVMADAGLSRRIPEMIPRGIGPLSTRVVHWARRSESRGRAGDTEIDLCA